MLFCAGGGLVDSSSVNQVPISPDFSINSHFLEQLGKLSAEIRILLPFS